MKVRLSRVVVIEDEDGDDEHVIRPYGDVEVAFGSVADFRAHLSNADWFEAEIEGKEGSTHKLNIRCGSVETFEVIDD